jgi:hypothetical protein
MNRHCNRLSHLRCLLHLFLWLPVTVCAITGTVDLPAQEIASHTSTAEFSSFFPFQVGSVWNYKVSTETEDKSGIHKTRGEYSDTVVAIDRTFGPAVQLVEIEEKGTAPDYAFCRDAARPLKWWYVVSNHQVFSRCGQKDAEDLASSLKTSSATGIVDGLEYVFPFHEGAVWGADPADEVRNDGMYQWMVAGKTDVKIPSGKFKGCYDVLFRTLPDHEERWICPGVGLVSQEYEHHGTENSYLIQLRSYSIGMGKRIHN